jgi:hypothetical protein
MRCFAPADSAPTVRAECDFLDFDSRESSIQANHVASGTAFFSNVAFKRAIGVAVVLVDSNSEILATGTAGGRVAFKNSTFEDIQVDEAVGSQGASVVLSGVKPMAFSDSKLLIFDGDKQTTIKKNLKAAARLTPSFLSLNDPWLLETLAVRRTQSVHDCLPWQAYLVCS